MKYVWRIILGLVALGCVMARADDTMFVDKVLISTDQNNGSFELNAEGLQQIASIRAVNDLAFWTGDSRALGTYSFSDTGVDNGAAVSEVDATHGAFLARIGKSGENNSIISGDTGYTVRDGDLYSLSFDYEGGWGWIPSGELEYFLYTEANKATPILSGTIRNFTKQVSLSFSTNLAGIVRAADIGENLMIEFNTSGLKNDFCYIDNVRLDVRSFPKFYDDSCEVYSVSTNVMGFGATHNGTNDNDSAAFQGAIDYLSSQGGGYLEVPAGTYAVAGVELKSDIHVRIDKNALLYGYYTGPTDKFTMFIANADSGIPLENISIRGVGGRFKFDLPDRHDGTRTISLRNVRNFLLSDFDIDGGARSYSSMSFGVEGFSDEGGGFPHHGTVQNISGVNQSAGYGLLQTQAGSSILFRNLYSEGGAALRLETGWDRMVKYQFGGVSDIVARDITAVNAKGAMMLGPHAMHNGVVNAEGLTAINCDRGVSAGTGYVKLALETPGLTPGEFAQRTTIRNVEVTFGMTAQYEKLSEVEKLAAEYEDDIVYYDKEVDDCAARAPSLYPAKILSKTVAIEGVRARGFKYQPPVVTDDELDLGFSDEIFSAAEYSTNLHGEFWSVSPSVPAGQTNWLSANGEQGLLDPTVAEENHHALNFWGFDIPADRRLIIRSDFRYYHQGGGNLSAHLNEAAFGLLISTDSDAAIGANRFCTLANRGSGIGFSGETGDAIAHASLGIDTVVGGWSDWLTLEWQVHRGTTDYTATPHLYTADGTFLLSGSTVDLGIANGTKLFAGYTTGTNAVGGTISSFSGFGEVQLDNFKFERDLVDFAPTFKEDKIVRAGISPNRLYRTSIAADAMDQNEDDFTFSKVSGPDWLTVWYDGTVSGTPGTNDVGAHIVMVQVAGSGGMNTVPFHITVHPLPELIQTIGADADAYVAGGSYSNANYGAYTPLSMRYSSNEKFLKEGYLRFDLSNIEALSISKVLLRLKLAGPGTKNHTHTFQFVADDSWGELDLDWGNKPLASTLLGTTDFPATQPWVEVDVTEQVKTEFAGDQVISMKIITDGADTITYHTKEAEMGIRPELVVYTLADGWAEYAYNHGLSSSVESDSDDDGQSDLYEYALGGNPTNSTVTGTGPEIVVETDTIRFVYPTLTNTDSGISYVAEWTDDLMNDSWTNSWDGGANNAFPLPGYRQAEQWIDGAEKSQLFFRLRVNTP